jgi:uncharacterized membrane protein
MMRSTGTRKVTVLGICLLALLTLAFYQVGDSHALSEDLLLHGGDFAAAAICHRISERSFTIMGRAMPLCARCSGIYLGIVLTYAIMLLAGRSRQAGLPRLPLMLALFGLIAVMGVDGLNSYSHFFEGLPHLYTPRNWLRLLTGFGTGLALGNFIFPVLAQSLWKGVDWNPPLKNFRELGGLIALSLVTAALVLSNQPVLLYVLAIVSVVGILLIFTSLNAVVMLMVFKREGRLTTWRQASVPLAIGLILTVTELGIVSSARLAVFGTISGLPGL